VASVEWLLFESLLAFVILVAIVGWTMGPLRRRRAPPEKRREHEGSPPRD
jgi:hypothetical protein